MKKFKFLSAIFLLILSLTLLPAIAAAAPATVKFYDTDNVSLLKTLPTVAHPAGGYYIDWKQLNNVPDYSNDRATVILTWAKKGEDTRCVLSNYAARGSFDVSLNRSDLIVLKADETLELIPLKKELKTVFDDLAYNSQTVDTHTDSPGRMLSGDWRPAPVNDLANESDRTNTAQGLYPYMKLGGSRGVLHAAFTANYPAEDISRGAGDRANSRILALLNATHWSAERNPSTVQLVTTTAGFSSALASGRIGIMQSIESCYSLTEENYEQLLEQYYDIGVRVLSFTWNPNSYLAAGNEMKFSDVDGITGPTSTGMTELGKKALAKMDQLGMVYDVSHTDDQTIRDALKAGKNPIIGSHSGARKVFDHVRNIWDPEIVAMAQKGGVIFQNFYGDFIEDPRGMYEIVNQIDYMVKLLEKPVADGGAGFAKGKGVEYIGMGTDFDGGTNNADANDARYVFRLSKELLARGYTAAEIRKILYENAFRVIDKVQGNASLSYRQGGTATITAATASGKLLGKGVSYAQLSTRAPVFTATVAGAKSARVIVDGIVYPSTLTGGTLTASLADTPLQENFHVVTFEAKDNNGKVTRNTYIFDVADAPLIHKVEFMYKDGKTPIKTVYVNNGAAITPADIPTETKGKAITGWTVYWTEQPFNTATALTRSYRLVSVGGGEPGGGDSGSGGGCDMGMVAGLLGGGALLALGWMKRKR